MHPQKPKETFNSSATPQESLSARQHSSACPWSATNNLRESLCASTPAVCALTRGSAGKGGGAGLACTRSIIVRTLGGGGGFSTRLVHRESEEIRVIASHRRRRIAGDSSRAGCSRVPWVLVSGWGIWQRTHLRKPCLSALVSSLIGAHRQRHLLGSSTAAAKQCHRCAPRQAASGSDERIRTRDDIEAARDGASSTSFSPMFY